MSKTTRNFITGAILLSISSMAAKFLGIFFKLPLVALIGDEGVGLYQLAYPLYTSLLAISLIGLPGAISKLVAEKISLGKPDEANHIFRAAFVIMCITGLAGFLFLWFGAPIFIKIFNWDERAIFPILWLAPAPLVVSLMSAFRGYFQGRQIMIPTAVSQIGESFGKVVFGLALARILLPRGLGPAAGGAIFGATAGGIIGLIILAGFYFSLYLRQRLPLPKPGVNREKTGFIEISRKIFSMAVPISMGSAVGSLMSMIDSFLIPIRLKACGFTASQATALFGQLSAKAQTLLNVPLTFGVALSMSLIPAISESFVRRAHTEVQRKINKSVQFVLLIGLPATAGLFLLGDPIIRLLFAGNPDGGQILSFLSLSLVFTMLTQTFTSILQGMGILYKPIANLFAGAVCKAATNYFLVGTTLFNIKGATLGSLLGFGIAFYLNYRDVKNSVRYKFPLKILWPPLISSIVMSLVIFYAYKFIPVLVPGLAGGLLTLITIFCGIIIYGFFIYITGGITSGELKALIRQTLNKQSEE